MFATARVTVLDADACALLYGLAVRALAAQRSRDGGGTVPASTAAVLRVLAAGARDRGADGSDPGTDPDDGGAGFTVTETAAAWGCTASYVRRLARLGAIPASKGPAGWTVPAEYVREQDGPPRAPREDQEP